jgi:hypothetical protein
MTQKKSRILLSPIGYELNRNTRLTESKKGADLLPSCLSDLRFIPVDYELRITFVFVKRNAPWSSQGRFEQSKVTSFEPSFRHTRRKRQEGRQYRPTNSDLLSSARENQSERISDGIASETLVNGCSGSTSGGQDLENLAYLKKKNGGYIIKRVGYSGLFSLSSHPRFLQLVDVSAC